MKSKRIRPFSNLKFENWKNLLVFAIICFYLILLFPQFVNGVGGDYQAFWSAGKIADVKGYSKIYNLSELRIAQQQIFIESGAWTKMDDLLFSPTPVPYFSVFITPFQFLSRLSLVTGFKVWTFLNLVLLFGYLLFFLRSEDVGNSSHIADLKLLITFLISYPVIFNTTCGQVEVLVLICTGEFIRQAVNKKPVLSGLWLGGLLLKPQLLIVIIPIFIIMRYWKALLGFLASSGIILLASLLLSGLEGMRALINLWIKYGDGIATSAPEIMINWRMVGVNINTVLNTSLGWTITGLGMVLTIIAVFYFVRYVPPYGSPLWVMTILGIFTATLALTWHSHYHMAMIFIPFLIYALVHKLLPEKIVFLWGLVPPVVFLAILLIESFFFGVIKVNPQIIVGFTGLILNMVVLFSVLQVMKIRNIIEM